MVKLYLVGGAVRDTLMGNRSKDYDFSVEAESYAEMKEWLLAHNFEPFLETEKHFTIRARRREPWFFADIDLSGLTFDFVLARKDGAYSDGRRPDSVEIGTIFDDLARRDFTMNAIAIDEKGSILDPHEGIADIEEGTIRCVGGTERLEEDPLRMMRAFRFAVTLGFTIDAPIQEFMLDQTPLTMEGLMQKVAQDRIRDELQKAMAHDTYSTIDYLAFFTELSQYIFYKTDLWLLPTSKGK